MISDIITFLSDGFWSILIRLFSQIGTNFYGMLFDKIESVIISLDNFYSYIDQAFDFITSFVVYCRDALLLYPEVFGLLILYLIFRTFSTYITYLVKLVVRWWHWIAP